LNNFNVESEIVTGYIFNYILMCKVNVTTLG